MYYVYTLIDPRDNKLFYIEKDDRAESHAKFKGGCNNDKQV